MADSKRQRLVDALVTRLKLINGSGGYDINLASRVEDSRTSWQQEELPAVSVFDNEDVSHPTSSANALNIVHEMSVVIRGLCEQGTTAATARKLIKDIQRAIRQDDKWTVSGTPLAMQTRQIRDHIVRNDDSYEIEGCEVEIAVQFITQKFNAEA